MTTLVESISFDGTEITLTLRPPNNSDWQALAAAASIRVLESYPVIERVVLKWGSGSVPNFPRTRGAVASPRWFCGYRQSSTMAGHRESSGAGCLQDKSTAARLICLKLQFIRRMPVRFGDRASGRDFRMIRTVLA